MWRYLANCEKILIKRKINIKRHIKHKTTKSDSYDIFEYYTNIMAV